MTTRTAVELRPAQPADADRIADLFLAARAATMSYLPRLHSDAETRAWVTHVMLPSHRVWVATRPDTPEVLGFAALDDDLLEHLYLHPDRRRQGIGSLLLAQVQQASPDGLSLHVFRRNENAIAFYLHHGFRLVSISDGAGNEEREPDATYRWTPPSPRKVDVRSLLSPPCRT